MRIEGKGISVDLPVPTKTIQIDDDNEYKWRATRIDFPTGTVVVCEWMHPNMGFWEEDCIWYLTMHMYDWECINIAETWEEWKTLDGYLDSFPQFRELFRKRDFSEEILDSSLNKQHRNPDDAGP